MVNSLGFSVVFSFVALSFCLFLGNQSGLNQLRKWLQSAEFKLQEVDQHNDDWMFDLTELNKALDTVRVSDRNLNSTDYCGFGIITNLINRM